MKNNNDRERFLNTLQGVAELTQFALTPMVVTFYLKALEPHGFGAVADSLENLARDCKPNSGFPSINQITRRLATGDDSPAKIASKAIGCISKFGIDGWKEARAEIGERGWQAITLQGGWGQFCDMVTYQNITTIRAQLRDSIDGEPRRILLK